MNCGEPIIDGLLANDTSVSPLTHGAIGNAVAYLQDLLRGHGYSLMPDPRVAGYGNFGLATARAVNDFSGGNCTIADNALLTDLVSRRAKTAVLSPAYLPLVLGIPFTTTAQFLWLSSLFETCGAFGAINHNTDGCGLSFGILQWSQRSGQLHNLLKACGFDPSAVEYSGRPSGGLDADGWSIDPAFEFTRDPWLAKFAALAGDPAMQRIQVTIASTAYDAQIKRIATWPGESKSERLTAFLLDLCNQFGPSRVQKQYAALATLTEAEIMQKLEDEFTALASPVFSLRYESAGRSFGRRRFSATSRYRTGESFPSMAFLIMRIGGVPWLRKRSWNSSRLKADPLAFR